MMKHSTILEVEDENREFVDFVEQNAINQTEFDPLVVSLIEERDRLHDIINQLKDSNLSFVYEVDRLQSIIDELRSQLHSKMEGNEAFSTLKMESIQLRIDNNMLSKENELLVAERRNMKVVLSHIESYLFSEKASSTPALDLVNAMNTLFDEERNSSDYLTRAKLAEAKITELNKEIEMLNHEMFSLREDMIMIGDHGDTNVLNLEKQLEQARKMEAHLRKRCVQLSNKVTGLEQMHLAENKQETDKQCSSSGSSYEVVPVFHEDHKKTIKHSMSFGVLRKSVRNKLSSLLRVGSTTPKYSPSSLPDSPNFENNIRINESYKSVRTAIKERTCLSKWNSDLVFIWLKNWVGLSPALLSTFSKLKVDGEYLCSIDDSKLSKILEIDNLFHRLKIIKAVEELRNYLNSSSGSPSNSLEGLLNHKWVSEFWLKNVGLTQYLTVFQHNLVDGRMLYSIKEDQNLFSELRIDSIPHQRSLYCSILLLDKLEFSRYKLEKVFSRSYKSAPLEFWGADSFALWLKNEGFVKSLLSFNQSGLNGAFAYNDDKLIFDCVCSILKIDQNIDASQKLKIALTVVKNHNGVH